MRPILHFKLIPLLTAAISASVGVSLSASTHAQSLLDMYQTAQSYDATYQSAKALYAANLAKVAQSNALLLPKLGLALNASRSSYDSTLSPPLVTSYGSQGATLSASHPLYRPADTASYDQAQKQISSAELQLAAAEQELMVRLSQAYFEVLGAQDSVAFIRKQKEAVAEQLASAKRNFEVGTATITDSREAQARFDLVRAQEIAADNDFTVKRSNLNQLIGTTNARPIVLKDGLTLPALTTAENEWIDATERNQTLIRSKLIELEVADLEIKKAKAGHLPTIDLQGSYTGTNNNGSIGVPKDYSTNIAAFNVVMNIPLFAGLSTQNRIKETLSLQEKARNDLEAIKRSAFQSTRTAFYGVQSGLGQVKAFEAAEASSQSALDANKLGYQVGVRINIDVLNSQSQLFDTKAKLSKARYDVLVGGLKLRQAAGTLKLEDLQQVNALLVK